MIPHIHGYDTVGAMIPHIHGYDTVGSMIPHIHGYDTVGPMIPHIHGYDTVGPMWYLIYMDMIQLGPWKCGKRKQHLGNIMWFDINSCTGSLINL